MTLEFHSKKVLVTGAGGFIGNRLVESLIQNGAHVTAFLRYTSRADLGLLRFLPPEILSEIELIHGDLRDFDALERATRAVDLVYHLGALISIPYSYLHPVETVETNIMGTLSVLQACRANNFKLIHTSSSEVYGTALRVPIDEDHPLQGQSPYSASKIGADKLVESYARAYAIQTVTVRPFNTYGPGQSTRAVIPTIITQALTQPKIQLGNLAATRDFTYVDDTVDGFLKAAKLEEMTGEVFNLGTGTEISIGDLAQMIIALIGKPVEIATDDQRLRPERSEVQRLVSDNRKAVQKLGWQPSVPLDDGLRHTIAWIQTHLDLYQPGVYGL
jgi:dTDP-glucose 4,6-dehydratase